jgi:hypothetical protein
MLSDSEASPERGKRGREVSTHLPGLGDSSDLRSSPSPPGSEKFRMTVFFCPAEPLAKHPRRGESKVENAQRICQD